MPISVIAMRKVEPKFYASFVQDELFLNGAVVLPHKEVKESVLQPTIIL